MPSRAVSVDGQGVEKALPFADGFEVCIVLVAGHAVASPAKVVAEGVGHVVRLYSIASCL